MSTNWRKNLAAISAACDETTRYVDLAVRLRFVRADFSCDVPEGYVCYAPDGTELHTLGAGRVGVPVVSAVRYASAKVPDGATLTDEAGAPVGSFRAEVILSAGQRWDTLRKCYDGPAREPLTYDLMAAQVEMAAWFQSWLVRWKNRQGSKRLRKERDHRSCCFFSDRGAGKTELCLWLVLAGAVEVPGTIAWVVSVSRPQSQEDVHERLKEMIPQSWGYYQGQPVYAFRLINRSRIREMTADQESDLKQGRVDLALLNEGAKTSRLAYAYTLGRISDRSGMLLIASNPPTPDVPKGAWVYDMHQQWEESRKKGEWFPMHFVQTLASQNAAIDQGARDDVGILLHAIDPAIAAADAQGLMRPFSERLIFTFDKSAHVQPPPETGDITRAITKKLYGREYDYIAGVDFQDDPYIIASFWRVYGSVSKPIYWCISSQMTEGNEDDFLDEWQLAGIPFADGQSTPADPGAVLWIGDSSAAWQDYKHRGVQATAYPPSFRYFKSRGLTIVPPAKKILDTSQHPKNPPLSVSYGHVRRLLKEGRCMISPYAAQVIECLHRCAAKKLRSGKQIAEPKWAHTLDTVRYPLWWAEPPTKREEPRKYTGEGVTEVA